MLLLVSPFATQVRDLDEEEKDRCGELVQAFLDDPLDTGMSSLPVPVFGAN